MYICILYIQYESLIKEIHISYELLCKVYETQFDLLQPM